MPRRARSSGANGSQPLYILESIDERTASAANVPYRACRRDILPTQPTTRDT